MAETNNNEVKVKVNPNPEKKDEKVIIVPPVEKEVESPSTGADEKEEENLEDEYMDQRSITISLVRNYSMYRNANMKVLGQRSETIGSSVTSCRKLSANRGEIEAYFPALLGLSPNNPEFVTRVKAWLSNIQFSINDSNVKLNTTFIYDHKRDYLKIKEQEDKIEAEYDKTDRSNIMVIRKALDKRINSLNTLESTKYKFGHPENLEEYLMYRHCLLYRDVAKDIALINSDPTIRFYIKDDAKEIEKENKLITARKIAMRNFVELDGSENKLNSVYVQIVVAKHEDLNLALLKDKARRSLVVMNYAQEQPEKFNKLVSDKNVNIKAFIETLISRGELVKSEFNQQISTADGVFIGANMQEAVAYFNNPNNKDVKAAYENKIKIF